MECNEKTVQESAYHFRFLPNAMHQAPIDDYYCAHYTGSLNNITQMMLSGCFYSTYNPCAFVTETEQHNMEYRCKYCNHHDGCNGSTVIGVSLATFFLYSLTLLA